MIEDIIHFWWLSDVTVVAGVGSHGNRSLLRTQAIHTWRRFFSVETEIRVICKSSKNRWSSIIWHASCLTGWCSLPCIWPSGTYRRRTGRLQAVGRSSLSTICLYYRRARTTFSVGTTPSRICRDVGPVCWCLVGPCKPGIPWVEPWGANAPRSRPICGRCASRLYSRESLTDTSRLAWGCAQGCQVPGGSPGCQEADADVKQSYGSTLPRGQPQ